MGNATTKSHYSKSQPLAATRRPRWEGSGRERHTHTYTDTDFRFCFCYASYPILVHASRSLEGMIRIRCVIRDGLSIAILIEPSIPLVKVSVSVSRE